MRFLASIKFLVFVLSKTVVGSNQNCYWVPVKYFPHCTYSNHHINKERDFQNYPGMDFILWVFHTVYIDYIGIVKYTDLD